MLSLFTRIISCNLQTQSSCCPYVHRWGNRGTRRLGGLWRSWPLSPARLAPEPLTTSGGATRTEERTEGKASSHPFPVPFKVIKICPVAPSWALRAQEPERAAGLGKEGNGCERAGSPPPGHSAGAVLEAEPLPRVGPVPSISRSGSGANSLRAQVHSAPWCAVSERLRLHPFPTGLNR